MYVDAKKAACKDVIMKGDDVDLSIIPALRLNPQDGQGVPDFTEGRYFTSLCVSKPTENAHNLSLPSFRNNR